MSRRPHPLIELRRIIGRRIRIERRRLKLSQEELAEQLGYSPNYVAHLERGTRGLSLKTLVRLAVGLRLAPHALLQPIPVRDSKEGED